MSMSETKRDTWSVVIYLVSGRAYTVNALDTKQATELIEALRTSGRGWTTITTDSGGATHINREHIVSIERL